MSISAAARIAERPADLDGDAMAEAGKADPSAIRSKCGQVCRACDRGGACGAFLLDFARRDR